APAGGAGERDEGIRARARQGPPGAAGAAPPLVRTPLILDARNCLDGRAWGAGGWTYHALGRPAPATGGVS
ncbi:hypothetical protein ACFW9D_27685, partial [Streptomyces sp. NPDC059524]